MSLLSARDTFVMFLNDALATLYPYIPVRWLSFDADDPEMSRLKINYVNVSFLSDTSDGLVDNVDVSIDVIHEKERTAIIWQNLLHNQVLRMSGMVKNKDYETNPDSPSDVYGYIFWDVRSIQWDKIPNDNYAHYNCTFNISHVTSL